jgi:hypothetical protein
MAGRGHPRETSGSLTPRCDLLLNALPNNLGLLCCNAGVYHGPITAGVWSAADIQRLGLCTILATPSGCKMPVLQAIHVYCCPGRWQALLATTAFAKQTGQERAPDLLALPSAVQVDCFDNLADWRQLGLILSEWSTLLQTLNICLTQQGQ